ncbi:hypothetical protein HYD54_00710 [Mycoplasmopsis bovis]|nr:hypothetical protein [Mycoplasmopsis bovis]QQH71773.1 hypothetical protein HYD54_00710 [Mycoplasmopsis bovis]
MEYFNRTKNVVIWLYVCTTFNKDISGEMLKCFKMNKLQPISCNQSKNKAKNLMITVSVHTHLIKKRFNQI